jgi:hypothetical protein
MWLWNICREEGNNTERRSELGHRFLKVDSMGSTQMCNTPKFPKYRLEKFSLLHSYTIRPSNVEGTADSWYGLDLWI